MQSIQATALYYCLLQVEFDVSRQMLRSRQAARVRRETKRAYLLTGGRLNYMHGRPLNCGMRAYVGRVSSYSSLRRSSYVSHLYIRDSTYFIVVAISICFVMLLAQGVYERKRQIQRKEVEKDGATRGISRVCDKIW